MRWAALALLAAGCDYVLGLERKPVVEAGLPDAPPDAPSCEGYVSLPTGTRYRLAAMALTFDAAQQQCAVDGTHLPVTPTSAELEAIQTWARGEGATTEIWVGVTNRVAPALQDPFGYEWITNEPAPVALRGEAPWAAGEPSNPTAVHCAAMKADVPLLDDRQCVQVYRFVCECDGYLVKPIY